MEVSAEMQAKLDELRAQARKLSWREIMLRMVAARDNRDFEAGHIAADNLILIALLKSRGDSVDIVWHYLSITRWYA